jgi:hypothetical protein
MNLTKEHFDKALKGLASKKDLEKFATKADLDARMEKQTAALMAYTDDRLESLAGMIQAGFEDLQQRLDVNDRIEKLEKDMKKIVTIQVGLCQNIGISGSYHKLIFLTACGNKVSDDFDICGFHFIFRVFSTLGVFRLNCFEVSELCQRPGRRKVCPAINYPAYPVVSGIFLNQAKAFCLSRQETSLPRLRIRSCMFWR